MSVLAGCGRVHFDDVVMDAAPPPFCASLAPAPTFCADFDGVDPWTDTGTTLATDMLDTANRSPPFSYEVTTETIIAGQELGAQERVLDLGTATRVSAAFDMRVDVFGQSDPVVAIIEFDDGTNGHSVEYVYREPPRVAYLEDVALPPAGSPVYTSFPFGGQPVGEWHRVTMVIDVVAGSLLTSLDGAITLDAIPAVTTSGAVSFLIGVPYMQGPSSEWQFHFDNVVVQLD